MEQEADYHFKMAPLWHSMSEAIRHDKPDLLSTFVTTPELRDGVFTFEEPLHPGSPFSAGHAMTPARAAVRVNATGCLRWLLAQGADPNDRNNRRGYYEYGLLASAIASGHERVVDILLSAPGIDRRLVDLDWWYIMPSVTSYSTGMLNRLIRHGFRPQRADSPGLDDRLRSVFEIIDVRIARCRAVCQILLRRLTRIRQRDLRTDMVRRFVWITRYDPVWTPDLPMPDGFN